MEVRIGIKHSPRELSFETEVSAEDLRTKVQHAIANDDALIEFADAKGRQYLVDAESISYIEIGAEGGRKVGFIS